MELTEIKFKSITINGGFVKGQIIALGLKYPLVAGWKEQLIGKNITDTLYDKLIKIKKSYLEKKTENRNNARYARIRHKGKKYKKLISKKDKRIKEENKTCARDIKKGKKMIDIELYAKKNKCTIAKAMIALM